MSSQMLIVPPKVDDLVQRVWSSLSTWGLLANVPDGMPDLYAGMHPHHHDRIVMVVNTAHLKNSERASGDNFVRHLRTVLEGRRVVVTNHRCLIYQIGFMPEPPVRFESKALDLTQQPSPLHLPVGHTGKEDLWISLSDHKSFLIGGETQSGKTTLLKAWILALLHGGQSRLILWDGKDGAKFGHWRATPKAQVVEGKLTPVLGELIAEMSRRAKSGWHGGERIVLVVDELRFALREDGVESLLIDLAARGVEWGIHLVCATQQTNRETITPDLQGNLLTRICFAVVSKYDSLPVLGYVGAEKLPKDAPGRLLMVRRARLIQAQAFQVPDEMLPSAAPPRQFAVFADDIQRRVALTTVQKGEFKIADIAEAVGISSEMAGGIGKRWVDCGWLTPIRRTGQGNVPRKPTQALRDLVADTDETRLGDLGESANVANLANVVESGANVA